MNAILAAPDLRLLAPAFAGRLALIIAILVALIARAFLSNPKLVPLTLPLFRRLNRTARGIARLMAGFVRRKAQRSGIECGRGILPPRERSRTPKPAIPTTHAWLVVTLRHEAAGYASQLSHLLNEPGVSDLLDAVPAARRLLNPLCRMLGLPATAPSAVADNRCPPSRTDATPPSTPPPKTPRLPPPPCPHVGWPWFPATPLSFVARDRCAPSRTESPRPRTKPA